MVKDTKERVTITLPKKMIELLKLRGNVSDQVKKALCLLIGSEQMPNQYELLKLGIDIDKDCYLQLGFYD